MEDGLLVQEGNALDIETGQWTILITLQTPSQQYGLLEIAAIQESAQHMLRTIKSLPEQEDAILTHQRRRLWTQRLQLILTNSTPHFSYNNHRSRRGLIDAGGKLLNMLFGVVTSDELINIQKQLDTARKDAQIANHNVNELISVVNQSRMAEQENRQRINNYQVNYDPSRQIKIEIYDLLMCCKTQCYWMKLSP